MTTDTLNPVASHGLQRIVRAAACGAGLTFAAFASYELTTRILTSAISSRDDQMLGGMWSAVATMFVCRETYQQGLTAAFSRTVATLLSFALCLAYLLLFPFSSWGMAILIGIGAMVLVLINRSEDIITNTITTAVVMVVAGISPRHAWMQPILRLADTLIGLAVGIAAVSIFTRLSAGGRLAQKKSQWKITKETTP
jgi:uncharacterized membrane protein YgaE (UPF0421/DUF939 family)